jgi:hypothetical protein
LQVFERFEVRIAGSAGAGWKPAILNAGKDAGAPRASSGAPPSRRQSNLPAVKSRLA